ncbi:hypothetical protein RHSIM_Rhsim10G0196800 [Rhododendron simsii]|uniref:PHD finger protein MALE STERILITY 1-like ubiquitin-like domain-containing protein n=1 Tax=Rhododendron simsii TaxID=118357 RepID=A0A834GBV8_RHOSS|nr:hypothetical protein RHSIM_Rhsim10G0196800 [Rhododendron simsii]
MEQCSDPVENWILAVRHTSLFLDERQGEKQGFGVPLFTIEAVSRNNCSSTVFLGLKILLQAGLSTFEAEKSWISGTASAQIFMPDSEDDVQNVGVGEVIVLQLDSTIGDLKAEVRNAMRDTYFATENLEVTEIEEMERVEDCKVLALEVVKHCYEIRFKESPTPQNHRGGENWEV